jgi:thiamine biosynthesis lipoprotein
MNTGGQVYAVGDKSGRPWRIAVQDPRSKKVRGVLEISDKSVSTSGDYEQYFLEGDRRYSHIINPLTGYPADSGVLSVTVSAQDGTTADALSTAIFVLGRKEGERIVRGFPHIEVKIIEKKDIGEE